MIKDPLAAKVDDASVLEIPRRVKPFSSGAELAALASLLLILALAAYLRLANQADTPGWYTDEGTHLEIARHLAEGRVQYLAIRHSTLLFAKLPLFDLLLAALLDPAEEAMITLRTLTGWLGVISVATLYGVVRRTTGDTGLALTAALLLAIYPQAVLYSRFGFSYNLLAPLALLTLLGLWRYLEGAKGGPPAEPSPVSVWWRGHTLRKGLSSERAGLALAALVVGVGAVSDLWMALLALPILLVAGFRRPWDVLWSLPLLLLPFGLYAAWMLLTALEAFLFDLQFTWSRLSSLTLAEQLGRLATNYTVLVTQDQWLALAMVGLFLLRPLRLQLLAWLLLVTPILVVGRTEAVYHLGFYYMIPLLPLISLGVAVLLWQGIPYAAHRLYQALQEPLKLRWPNLAGLPPALPAHLLKIIIYGVIITLAAAPFLTTTAGLVRQTREGFTTTIDPFLIEPQQARYAAQFANLQTLPEDVVIASPGVAWLLQANTADFQMAVAFNGQATPHLPASLPPERFAFNPDYRQARFVIVDNLWHTWAVFNVNGVPQMLETVQSWPIRFQTGNITVYCNPNQPDC